MEELLSSRLIYEGRVVKLKIETVRRSDGRETTREIVEHSDCIAMVALDAENNVLLVNQYREAIGKELLEIPAGGIDPGESAEDAVRREMQEETGFLPKKLVRLGGFYTVPGYGTEYLHVYFVTGLSPSRLYAEDTAAIKLVRVPLDQIHHLLTSNQICDSKSIAGLFMFFEYRGLGH